MSIMRFGSRGLLAIALGLSLSACQKAPHRAPPPLSVELVQPKTQDVVGQQKGQILQDPFLNLLRKEHVPVAIYLVNGIKLQGFIESFDQFVVLLRNNVSQMIYKHAISTVVPSRDVRLPLPEEEAAASPEAEA